MTPLDRIAWLEQVAGDAQVSLNAMRVAVAIAGRVHRDGKAVATRAQIAQYLKLHPDTVKRSSRALEELGHLLISPGVHRGKATEFVPALRDNGLQPSAALSPEERAATDAALSEHKGLQPSAALSTPQPVDKSEIGIRKGLQKGLQLGAAPHGLKQYKQHGLTPLSEIPTQKGELSAEQRAEAERLQAELEERRRLAGVSQDDPPRAAEVAEKVAGN